MKASKVKFTEHWPKNDKFNKLRTTLQDYVACQTIFGTQVALIEKKYKSPKTIDTKTKNLLEHLIKQHNKVGDVLDEYRKNN